MPWSLIFFASGTVCTMIAIGTLTNEAWAMLTAGILLLARSFFGGRD